jgi:hypothetical protein
VIWNFHVYICQKQNSTKNFKMVKQLILVAWIGLVGISLSCDGPKGDVGPAGPAGAQGPAGAKGDTGVAGTDALGAKMITTGMVKSDNGGYTLGVSNLTPADTLMLQNAGVFVYIKSQDYWWSLPGTVPFGDGKATTFEFSQAVRNGRTFFVRIKAMDWLEEQPTAPDREFEAIRVIIVPAENFRRVNAQINWKDYNAVVKSLNLKESSILKADL